MTLQELTSRVADSVGADSGLDAVVKFKFGEDGVIRIDGLAKPNQVTNDDTEATITITLSRDNFERILDHELSPQKALMTGKMRLRGDMRIALRLNRVFGID
jgi:putative sterol carrier protein